MATGWGGGETSYKAGEPLESHAGPAATCARYIASFRPRGRALVYLILPGPLLTGLLQHREGKSCGANPAFLLVSHHSGAATTRIFLVYLILCPGSHCCSVHNIAVVAFGYAWRLSPALCQPRHPCLTVVVLAEPCVSQAGPNNRQGFASSPAQVLSTARVQPQRALYQYMDNNDILCPIPQIVVRPARSGT